MLTDGHRYRALSAGLRRLRGGGGLRIRIRGEQEIELACDDIAIEGASTSFQVHLRVDPGAFADAYNAAQIATAPVLAASTNAPLLLGRPSPHRAPRAAVRTDGDPDAVSAMFERYLAAAESGRPVHEWPDVT